MSDPTSWPTIWRVIMPAGGSYDHDVTFLETPEESQALDYHSELRAGGFAVRLEYVRVGPLPAGYLASIAQFRSGCPQNPGSTMREIPAAWVIQ